jgi:LysM repeat protein
MSFNTNSKKSKIQLSDNLQMGIAAPSSQGTFFKVGGVIFMILSILTAINIAKQVHKTNNSPANAPTATVTTPQQVLGAYSNNSDQIQTTTYVVQTGDTLFDIAQNQGVSWQIIATLNNLKQPYTLKPGTKIKLPKSS